MCHFSFKENYIFIRIPKCAGSSWIWEDERCLRWDESPLITHGNYTYLEAKSAFEKMGKSDFFNNCNIFTRVRNPIDRTRSLYCYIKTIDLTHPLHTRVKDMSYESFVPFILSEGSAYHKTCYHYLKDENHVIPERIKIERVEDLPIGSLRINQSNSEDIKDDEGLNSMIKSVFIDDYKHLYHD